MTEPLKNLGKSGMKVCCGHFICFPKLVDIVCGPNLFVVDTVYGPVPKYFELSYSIRVGFPIAMYTWI
jgi:hypothetical protein